MRNFSLLNILYKHCLCLNNVWPTVHREDLENTPIISDSGDLTLRSKTQLPFLMRPRLIVNESFTPESGVPFASWEHLTEILYISNEISQT